jgi:hypothetical protein
MWIVAVGWCDGFRSLTACLLFFFFLLLLLLLLFNDRVSEVDRS